MATEALTAVRFASSSTAAGGASSVIHPDIDPLLRHLAHFWAHRRHVHRLFSAEQLDDGQVHALQQLTSPNRSSFNTGIDGFAAISPNSITYQPLLIVISIGITLLLVDTAFGSLIRKPTAPIDAYAESAASRRAGSSKSSIASTPTQPSTPSTEEELKDAADEWAYFRRTKCRVLILSMVLGFASEFLLWMLAPFFPLEAQVRGVSTEMIGLVFACHPIALGVSSQLAPWLMRNVRTYPAPPSRPRTPHPLSPCSPLPRH